MSRRQRHVDVFEESLRGDAPYAVGELDEVIAGASGLFTAESVGKDEGFGELTSAHQETGVVDDPLACKIHGAFFHPAAGQVRLCFEWSDCTRAEGAGQYHKNCATVEFPVARWA